MNLVVNARDAMPAGRQAHHRNRHRRARRSFGPASWACRPGRMSCISITDTGVGMDEKTQSHLFEPFFTTKNPARAPVWAWPRPMASFARAAAPSASSASWARARPGASTSGGRGQGRKAEPHPEKTAARQPLTGAETILRGGGRGARAQADRGRAGRPRLPRAGGHPRRGSHPAGETRTAAASTWRWWTW